jgi:hypothetical protein
MTETYNPIDFEKLSLSSNSELNIELNIESSSLLNIAIGSKIKLFNSNIEYIFYGYNHNQTLFACFPTNSTNAVENMIYIPIKKIETIF